MDLLTTYTHHLELQVITAPSLIFTLYRSLLQTLSILQPAVSSLAVPWQRLLTAEILEHSALRSFLSSEYPASEVSAGLGSGYVQPGGRPTRKHRFQHISYCYGRLPSDSSDVVDVFTGCYQATPVVSFVSRPLPSNINTHCVSISKIALRKK